MQAAPLERGPKHAGCGARTHRVCSAGRPSGSGRAPEKLLLERSRSASRGNAVGEASHACGNGPPLPSSRLLTRTKLRSKGSPPARPHSGGRLPVHSAARQSGSRWSPAHGCTFPGRRLACQGSRGLPLAVAAAAAAHSPGAEATDLRARSPIGPATLAQGMLPYQPSTQAGSRWRQLRRSFCGRGARQTARRRGVGMASSKQ